MAGAADGSKGSWRAGCVVVIMLLGFGFNYENVCISIVIIGLRPKWYGTLLFSFEWCANMLYYYIVQSYNFGAL